MYYPYQDYISAQRCMKTLSFNKILSTHEISIKVSETRNAWPQKRIKSSLKTLKNLGYIKSYRTIKAPQKHQCGFKRGSALYLMDENIVQRYLESIKNSKDPQAGKIIKNGFVPQKIRFPLYCKICGTSNPSKIGKKIDANEFKISKYEYWELTFEGILIQLAVLRRKEIQKLVINFRGYPIIKLISILEQISQKFVVDQLIHELKSHVLQTPNLTKIANEWFYPTVDEFCAMKISKQKYPEIESYQFQLRLELDRERALEARTGMPRGKFPNKFWYSRLVYSGNLSRGL